eukprot:SAG31_NODE_25912_length_451_cov_1.704545_1_plen_32_part_10
MKNVVVQSAPASCDAIGSVLISSHSVLQMGQT